MIFSSSSQPISGGIGSSVTVVNKTKVVAINGNVTNWSISSR